MVRLAAWLVLGAVGLSAATLSPTAQSVTVDAQALSPAASAILDAVSRSATALSPSADALAPLPARPLPPTKVTNSAWEGFAGVTLLSAPFTAFWSVLGALIVESLAQRQFPPDFGQDRAKATLAAAAGVAAGSSVIIGLVSLHWGGSPSSPTAQALPSPQP